MKEYKYQLRKTSKKEICPNCKKKRFTPYVLVDDNEKVADIEKYGLCDRSNSCGYHAYPEGTSVIGWAESEESSYKKPYVSPDFISKELVESSFNKFNENTFFMYLVKIFGSETALELQEKYNIGTAKSKGAIYWQEDSDGKFRTGKVMYYQSNGKRNKNRNSWYVHNKIKKDYNLMQVLFGEHLIKQNPDKPVALVESEKSAILLSVFFPDYTWIASGGMQMLNSYRLLRLPRLDLVCPDKGAFELWEKQTNIFHDRMMDVSVENAFYDGILQGGDDLLDLILIQQGLNDVRVVKRIKEKAI